MQRAINAISPGKNLNHDSKQGQLCCRKVKIGKKMWSCDTELGTNGVEPSKGWLFIVHFSIRLTPQCRCHAGTNILRELWLHSLYYGSMYCQALNFWLRINYSLEM